MVGIEKTGFVYTVRNLLPIHWRLGRVFFVKIRLGGHCRRGERMYGRLSAT